MVEKKRLGPKSIQVPKGEFLSNRGRGRNVWATIRSEVS